MLYKRRSCRKNSSTTQHIKDEIIKQELESCKKLKNQLLYNKVLIESLSQVKVQKTPDECV